jgi:hypothetical protein
MIGQSKKNEKLHDTTPKGMLLDVCVSPKKNKLKKIITND